MTNYLIIGNGVAGTSAAEQIRKNEKKASITIVTQEDMPFYSRMRLPEYIAKTIKQENLIIKSEKWHKDNAIDLVLSSRIIKADAENKVLFNQHGQKFNYDVLLIATGSHSFLPPIEGMDKEEVFTLRDIKDARNILARLDKCSDAVFIGAGLLGLETGNALRMLGKKTTIIGSSSRLLPRQLDVQGAKKLQSIMEGMGFNFYLGAKTTKIAGNDHVKEVVFENGATFSCGMVIVSAGVRPNMELGEMLGLEMNRGIIVNENMETSLKRVYAAGDVAEFNGRPYGIWPAASEQGKIAGDNMIGNINTYNGTTMSNKLKISGIDLASAGIIDDQNKMENKILSTENIYKKLVFSDDMIVGCIMLGDTRGFNQIVKAITAKKSVAGFKEDILSDDFDLNRLKN